MTIPALAAESRGEVSQFTGIAAETGSDSLGAMIVDSIEIDNRNIYDTRQPAYDNFLFRAANKLHLKTRQRIIRQELLLKRGRPFSRELAEETSRNLRARLPLNDAWVEVVGLDDHRVLVRVVTVDQWSLLGGVRSVDRSDRETRVQVGLEEKNLLGLAQFLSFDYYWQDHDENYVTASFRESRVLGRALWFQLDYSSNPESRLRSVLLGRPFYNLAQRFAYTATATEGGGRRERYFEGSKIAQWESRYDATRLELDCRLGPYHRKTTFTVACQYVSNRVSDRATADPRLFGADDFPDDSVYYSAEAGVAHAVQDYAVLKRLNGFEYNEDVILGAKFGANVARAFSPYARGSLFDAMKLSVGGAVQARSLLINGQYDRSFWFRGGTDFRRLSQFGLWGYFTRYRFVTLAFRSWYGSDKSADHNPLDLGGKNGLRGYITELTSGDRYHVINLEARFYSGIEILSVLLGAAVFTDLGRTWASGRPVVLRDYYESWGAGLRISLEKLSRAELIRADVAFTRDGHWELLLGTGQYF